MELNWIEDFLALSRTGNFTAAAAERHLTQPAFSRRVQLLEEWCGAKLFNRDARPVTLTEAGILFQSRAERLRVDMMDARRAVKSAASRLDRPRRIWTTNTIATSFFPEWARSQALENYTLAIASVTGCQEALRQKRCDAVLIPSFEPLPGGTVLYSDVLTPVIRPDRESDVRAESGVLHGPFLLYAPGTAFGEHVERLLKRENIALATPPLCESASAEALWAQVKAGFGCAWIPRIMVDADVATPECVSLLSVDYDIVLLENI